MTGTSSLRVGLIPLARTTFDIPLASQITAQVHTQLIQAGLTVSGTQDLISSVEQFGPLLQEMAGDPPDLLLILQATFADSDMAASLAQAVDAPLLLWAVPEAASGGRLRLNSLCGVNLAAHALKRAGQYFDYVYGPPADAAALNKVRSLALAGRARRWLRQARLGRIGQHPDGFVSCQFDGAALKARLGLEVVQIELADLFQDVRAVDAPAVESVLQDWRARLAGLDELPPDALRGTLRAFVALRERVRRQGLHALAVRCWPEFFTDLGCAACGAMSMLSDQLTPCSCEVDVNGAVTQLILQQLSGEPAFGSDLVSIDAAADTAVLWHCGLAPLAMSDPAARPRGVVHSNRQLPLLLEFPLKPGRVTLARLSAASGGYRMVIGGGEMLSAPLSFSGTSGVLRFDRPAAQVLDTIIHEGLEHHISLTYGDHSAALLALCEMLQLPVLFL